MRKSFSFLLAIGVCALLQIGAAGQTPEFDQAILSDSTKPSESQALSGADLRNKLREAKQLLKTHADMSSAETVTLAAFDPETSNIDLLTVDKEAFLTKDAKLLATSQRGRAVRITVIRANGVNTAVTVNDISTGRTLVPLMIAYPIVLGGSVTEIAYYTSAHPALVSDNVISSGQSYVTAMLDNAAKNLANQGINIPSDIVEVAEHLCVVEHTDHKRFMNEEHTQLFPEILSLYALNQGNTYRYSVSTAGAGGMIQMIPRTYQGIREQHPTVPLQGDFVSGMRDHANALQAMLLYMNDTWNKLEESSEVRDALRTGIATKPELLAAGYNSNPIRLPSYLKNGGSNWQTLIPGETQMYLAIYKAVDQNVNFDAPREGEIATIAGSLDLGTSPPHVITLMSWLTRALVANSSVMIRFLP